MTELQLDGLNCASCAAKIEESLKANDFLKEVNFSFATKKLTVTSHIEREELKDLIQREVDKIEEGVTVSFGENRDREELSFSFRKFLRKHGSVLSGALIFLSITIFTFPDPVRLFLYGLSYILIGGDIVWKALKDLIKGKLFDENFLMTLATVGAFALGEWTEAVAVMLFYKVGEGFQDYAVDKSRRSIKSLLNIRAEFANRIKDGVISRVKPEDLVPGDLIMVKNGEKVPVDGLIREGKTRFDTSALTGESRPRSATEGEEILSGFINRGTPVVVEVRKEFINSAVSRILHMVENAAGKKAVTEQFITKFAKIYTPIVVTAALILAFVPPLLSMGTFGDWISRALIFLVISCPCALVLSVPLGYFGGLGTASRKGILIKGGNYLEALNNTDTFVFDKTGTLTKGNFSVESYSSDEVLELAALAEQHSTHPIARAVMEAYGKAPGLHDLSGVEEIPGCGIKCVYRDKELLAGNEKLLRTFGIEHSIPATTGETTLIHIAYDGRFKGTINIRDEIKPSSIGLSAKLKALGAKKTVMLTGDRAAIAKSVAEELEIDEYRSELLPEDKLSYVEAMTAQGRKVLFAGDGINDAPVLAGAHIGVAMGGLGSDAAIEAADIVLMTDEPSKLIDAMHIARKTRKIVLQNIVFALGVKLFFLSLGALGMATMYEAVFADVGVALLAVLNSMRILKE
ncbi:heavy metal translocating P-type ATPase [Spirochaeta isovalerica]|uniref:P-type Zn(2+) transporter n=1 Tax=Spirochaeta isovalerica TaxID=150 RepID=A0A841RDD0_9SPIO|nr:heavy metal translocating P-type ATPase [Spirochaeta isovalerica]MBB6480392.1 Cd2+/Zn2+-exporting ATPase [Spirochaeta isovalerica]